MKKIAVLLDGGIINDGRVRRIIHSLSQKNKIDLFYIGNNIEDDKIFNKRVNLFRFSIKNNWISRNFLFQNKFIDMENHILNSNEKYDFIYCNDYPLLKLAVKLKEQNLNSKLIYDTHEIWIETINQMFPTRGVKRFYGGFLILINKLYHQFLEYKFVKKTDVLVTVCDSFKDYFENKFNLKNVLVIRNCPEIEGYYSQSAVLREKLNLNDEVNIVLYQGNLNDGRGLLKSIKSFKKLDSNFVFVILGGGHLLQNLKDYCLNEKIYNVIFVKKVPFSELLEYTQGADIGIMLIQPINLSKELTLPNKVFEYMYAGIPVITNHLPEAKKILLEENCGFVINDQDEDIIAKEIKNIFINKEELKIKGNNGYQSILSKYNWKNEILKLEQMINSTNNMT